MHGLMLFKTPFYFTPRLYYVRYNFKKLVLVMELCNLLTSLSKVFCVMSAVKVELVILIKANS